MAKPALHFNVRKNIIFSAIAFTCNIALVFLSYRLVINKSGLEAIGLWSTMYAWTTIIRLGDAGMVNASLRFIALCDPIKDRERLRGYLETGLIANIILFSTLGVIGYVVLYWNINGIVERRFIAEGLQVLPLMITSFVLLNVSSVLMGSLQGLHLGYINSQISIVSNIVQITCVLVLVPNYGIKGLAWSQIIQYCFTVTTAWYYVQKMTSYKRILPTTFSITAFREMVGFSVKAQAANIANGLFEPLSKILVGHFGGLQAVGLYELAYKTVSLTRNVVVTAMSATLPAMTTMFSTSRSEVQSFYQKVVRLNIRFASVLLIIVACATPLISRLWIGHVQKQYILYCILISAGFIVNAYGAPAYQLGTASGHMKNNIITTFLSLAILLGLGSILGSILGSGGVVFAAGLALAICGFLVKLLNERALFGSSNIIATDTVR